MNALAAPPGIVAEYEESQCTLYNDRGQPDGSDALVKQQSAWHFNEVCLSCKRIANKAHQITNLLNFDSKQADNGLSKQAVRFRAHSQLPFRRFERQRAVRDESNGVRRCLSIGHGSAVQSGHFWPHYKQMSAQSGNTVHEPARLQTGLERRLHGKHVFET